MPLTQGGLQGQTWEGQVPESGAWDWYVIDWELQPLGLRAERRGDSGKEADRGSARSLLWQSLVKESTK